MSAPALMLAGLNQSGTVKAITVLRSPVVVDGPLWGVVLKEVETQCYTREKLLERRDESFMQNRAVLELIVTFDICPGSDVAHQHQEGVVLLQHRRNTEASAS